MATLAARPTPPPSPQSALRHLQLAQDHLALAAVELAERTHAELRLTAGEDGSLMVRELAALTTDLTQLTRVVYLVAERLAAMMESETLG